MMLDLDAIFDDDRQTVVLDSVTGNAKQAVTTPTSSDVSAVPVSERCGTTPSVFITPDDLPWDWRIEWLERAAIREIDGGQCREHAEAEALAEVVVRMRAASTPE